MKTLRAIDALYPRVVAAFAHQEAADVVAMRAWSDAGYVAVLEGETCRGVIGVNALVEPRRGLRVGEMIAPVQAAIVPHETPARDAAAMLVQAGHAVAVVVDDDGRFAGLVTPESLEAAISQRHVQSEALLHDCLLTAMNGSIIVGVTDPQGRITQVNDAFCRISGYSQDALIGSTHRLVNSGHHDGAFWADLWTTISGGRLWRGDICNRSCDGRLFWVDTTIAPLRGVSGQITGYVSTLVDITASKTAAEREARAVQREAMATVAAGVAHEFGNLLLAAQLHLECLRDLVPAGAASSFDAARIAIQQSQSLSGALLELYAGAELRPAGAVVLNGWLPAALAKLESVLPHDVTIKLDLPPAAVVVRAHELGLEQVLRVLLTNAAEAMDRRGRIWLSVARGGDGAGFGAELRVADDGPGIPAQVRDRIFDPFCTTRTKARRSGLGLAIASRLAELFGATMHCEPNSPRGTAFLVRFQEAVEG